MLQKNKKTYILTKILVFIYKFCYNLKYKILGGMKNEKNDKNNASCFGNVRSIN